MVMQFLLNGLITGSIYALIALGFALVYNTTRIFHIAYAVLYMIAPYFLMTFLIKLQISILLSILIAIALTTIVSLAIEFFVYAPLEKKKSSTNVLMISSIGVMIIVINLIALFYGNETKILNPSLSDSYKIGKIIITYNQIIQFITSSVVIGLFMVFLKFSKFGIMTRAMRDDTELCKVFSMNVPGFRLVLFAISGLFAAIGGILTAWDFGMDPYVGMPMLLNAIVALIIGGIGKFQAPIIGGLVLGILQALSVMVFSANWKDAIAFSVLVLFLLFRPQGFIGEKRRLV